MENDCVVLEDFPSVATHWPSCVAGCIEAISKYQFDTPSFADCEYDHTFRYERASRGGIRRDREGTNLEVKLEAIQVDFATIAQRIRDTYGVEFRRHFFTSADGLEAFVHRALRSRCVPALTFDWFYVEGRREYRKIHAPHCMCLIGMVPGGGPVHLVDQYHGRLKIAGDTFADFVAYANQDGRQGVRLMEFVQTAVDGGIASNRLVELERNLRLFLDNLLSTDSTYGLAALEAFKSDVSALMEAERDSPAVFYVPGMWQFAMQRSHLIEALNSIERAHPDFSFAGRDDLVQKLGALHRGWFDLNYNAEAALITNRPRLLAKAMAGLDAIIRLERDIPPHFESMLRAFD